MGMKTRVAAALCVPLMTIAGAGAAYAGEVKGPPVGGGGTGGSTPIVDHVANSECAYSGLNAFHDGKPIPEGPAVQSYGMGVRAGFKGEEWWPSPGVACNGHLNPTQMK